MAKQINEGGPAFPVDSGSKHLGFGGSLLAGHPGMTKREWYAGKALAGLLASNAEMPYGLAAEQAVHHADFLISELKKENRL